MRKTSDDGSLGADGPGGPTGALAAMSGAATTARLGRTGRGQRRRRRRHRDAGHRTTSPSSASTSSPSRCTAACARRPTCSRPTGPATPTSTTPSRPSPPPGSSRRSTATPTQRRHPRARCHPQAADSSFWVGLDGYTSTVGRADSAPTRTAARRGTPIYYAWYEMYPASSVHAVEHQYPVSPGDTMTAMVMSNAAGTSFNLAIKDATKGWMFSIPETGSGLRPLFGRGRGRGTVAVQR